MSRQWELPKWHGPAMTEPLFLWPEPELVDAMRAGIEAHKAAEAARNLGWIKHCKRLLEEGEGNA